MNELECISQNEFHRALMPNALWGKMFSGLIENIYIQLTLEQYWLEVCGSTHMWIFSINAYYTNPGEP